MTTATAEDGSHRLSRAFQPDPSVARECRAMLRAALGTWGLPGLYDDAALVLTELVSNAIRSDDVIVVDLYPESPEVVLEVFDCSPALPRTTEVTDEDESGRGLPLIEAYASAWSYVLVDGGKVVRARVSPG